MNSLDEIRINSYVNQALFEKSLGNDFLFNNLIRIANPGIEKSVEGRYIDNYMNRKLGIVGQPYKHHKKEKELPSLKNQTSEDLYKERGVWSKSRALKVHLPIVKKYEKDMVFEKKPRAYLMLGGGGSGKGFFLDKMKESDPSLRKLPTLDIDEIRVNDIPDYKRVWDKEKTYAANYVHNEVSYLGDKIESMYVDKKSSFIRDAVFGDYSKLETLVNKLSDLGYDIHLIGVATDFETAKRRIDHRFKTKGRFLDLDIAKKGHKGASETFYKVITGKLKDKFSKIKLLNGNDDKSVIYEDGKISDIEGLAHFVNKRNNL